MSTTDETATQQPGIKRTDLQRHDLRVPGREVSENRVDIGPEAPFVNEYHVEGKPPMTLNAGDVVLVPAETKRTVRSGAMRLLVARRVHC